MRCKSCINDESVAGYALEPSGACNFCVHYESSRARLNDFARQKRLWDGRLARYRGRGSFDALLGLSGGKDSTYVLYQLVRTHGLRVMTFTLDNGFLPDAARQQIESVAGEFGVPHRYVEPSRDALRLLFRASTQATSAPCTGCAYLVYSSTVSLAAELGIPMAVHGRSRAQMLRYYVPGSRDPFLPFVEAALTPVDELDLSGVYAEALRRMKASVPPEFAAGLAAFMPDFSVRGPVELVAYFLFHPYDDMKIASFLEENTQWRRPAGYERLTHFDCTAHDAASYLYEISEGRPHLLPEVSVLVREGVITRAEALARVERARFLSCPHRSMAELAAMIRMTVPEMVDVAREVASRRASRR